MKKLIVLCLLLWGCQSLPQYDLYVYYIKTCPSCHFLLKETIPLLQEKYDQQLKITTYDMDEKESQQSFKDICQRLKVNPMTQNKGSVPFIVLDGYFVKIGYQVNEQDQLIEAIDTFIKTQEIPTTLDEIYEFKDDKK